jgi:hypothetical protein
MDSFNLLGYEHHFPKILVRCDMRMRLSGFGEGINRAEQAQAFSETVSVPGFDTDVSAK